MGKDVDNIPYSGSLARIGEWLTVSNALLRSINRAHVRFPLSIALCISSVKSRAAVSVLRHLRKPNCCVKSRLFDSRWCTSWL